MVLTLPVGLVPDSEMQSVSGGSFWMGTNRDELEQVAARTRLRGIGPLLNEVPAHEVHVDNFHIDRFAVTNQQFSQFVENNPGWRRDHIDKAMHNGRYLEHWTELGPTGEQLSHPVTFVTWQGAAAYCQWRGKRLPTEAEFEWAAQDGVSRAAYPWGDAEPSDDLVNWGGNNIDTTVAVGSYPPNGRGLYDMAGNVWQFTADPWLGSYAELLEDPAKAKAASSDPNIRRVVRGGSWGANAANLRIRYRDSHRPFDAREMVGFRCAR